MRVRFPALNIFPGKLAATCAKFGALAATAIVVTLLAAAPAARAQNFGDSSKWELGGHYAQLSLPNECTGVSRCDSGSNGLGGNLSYNFGGWIGFDSEMDFFADNGNASTALTGGRVMEGLFGLRFGPTTPHWGLYSVIRPGFVSFGRVLDNGAASPLTGSAGAGRFGALAAQRSIFRAPGRSVTDATAAAVLGYTHTTDFAFNYGETLEYRPTKHFGLRFDIGDTIVSYPEVNGSGSYRQHNFQVSEAFVIRF